MLNVVQHTTNKMMSPIELYEHLNNELIEVFKSEEYCPITMPFDIDVPFEDHYEEHIHDWIDEINGSDVGKMFSIEMHIESSGYKIRFEPYLFITLLPREMPTPKEKKVIKVKRISKN